MRVFIGCPNDSKKIPDAIEGKDAVCPKCGNIVKPKSLQWALFLVADNTDEIIASFPPSIINRPTERMSIVAQGLLGENEEFLVYKWGLPSENKNVQSSEQPLSQYFKPVEAAPSVPSPVLHVPSSVPSVPSPTKSAPPSELELGKDVAQTDLGTRTTAGGTRTTAGTLQCPECNAGPFKNNLELQGHKASVHAKKPVQKRRKQSTVQTGTANTAVPRPIPFVATPEQATLPTAPTGATLVPAAPMEPIASIGTVGTLPTGSKETPKVEELKAVEGASLPSIKYTKLSGLVGKPLEDFKAHFAVNFPKDDMIKALDAAHCTIVEGKIVFTGG